MQGGSEKVIDIAPAGNNNLPQVTIAMLYDFLQSEEVVCAPKLRHRVFRWMSAEPRDDAVFSPVMSVASANVLHIVPLEDARQLLSSGGALFAIAVDSSGEGLLEGSLAERAIVVRTDEPYEHFVARMHAYFVKLFLWEAALERIVAQDGSFTELLDASTSVLRNFIFVSDNDFNVIARTTHIEPPDDLHRSIIQGGCLTPRTIQERRYRLPEQAYYTKEPSGLTPYARLSRPIHLNHAYYCSVSMSCNNAPLTEGLKDLFAIFISHFIPACQRKWQAQMASEVPHYFFFERLLNGEVLDEGYVHAQLEMVGVPEEADLKVVAFSADNNTDPAKARKIMRRAAGLSGGNALCFPFEDVVVALLWSEPSDSNLSHRSTIADLKERVCVSCEVVCGMSEVFAGITNLDLAYRQAKTALSFRRALCREQFALPTEQVAGVNDKIVYLFGDVFLYYLISPHERDDRFVRFCFHHTIVFRLYEEDWRNGTNILEIFWFYLYYERSATKTAQHLHVHRNTVLYHIDKIQKRFDFDLSWHVARERLTLEFKAFFLEDAGPSLNRRFRRPRLRGGNAD